jgi:HPt (histidine-containing phosphotransfer) domain-containing protein
MTAEPVDLVVARRWVGGDRALLLELVGIFVEEASARIRELRDATASGDARELERVAHSLKGSATILGARSLQDLCAALEDATRERHLEPAPALVERIDGELGRVVAFFKDAAWPSRFGGVEG